MMKGGGWWDFMGNVGGFLIIIEMGLNLINKQLAEVPITQSMDLALVQQ